MLQVNIHEAKTHLSMLVDKASKGESFIIAKAGKPMAKVIPFVSTGKQQKRVGFLQGASVPDNFDIMCAEEIVGLFEECAQ
ncbi:MAG: type II toxin-antitoxin system prevent-host-death family antitoxin [Defluviitaleaceae bacterium]|nr:type II toxin-antitoxin system prevent-host-death family antitoxin [Defluviitaleaceae bacterium]